jgi:predicted ATPase
MLTDVCDHLGHPEDSLQALVEAHTLVEQHEERYWEAEVHRLRGVLLLHQEGTLQAEAEAWLQRALDVARRQEALTLLAPLYGWFTEGFDTADLQEARVLLEELAG